MNNAEMRSRLTLLGLSLKQFSTITGWDYRELRRIANGEREVSPRTSDMVDRLEDMADVDLAVMQAAADNGEPIAIPFFSDHGVEPYFDEQGQMPGSYWHALAGTILATTDGTTVEYRKDPS